MARMPGGKYRLIIGEEVAITRTGDRKEDIIVNTQKFTRIIEDMVRKYPDQWFWAHQRWKTQPLIVTENTTTPEMPE
jgi:KDO2-lipid IV(A) lauroyltransferase